MRPSPTLVVLTGLLVACSAETRPTADLDCFPAAAPSLAVTFGISTGGEAGHTWVLDHGDGSASDSSDVLAAPSHTYAQPGRYTARLTVTSGGGTARDECVVTVPQP